MTKLEQNELHKPVSDKGLRRPPWGEGSNSHMGQRLSEFILMFFYHSFDNVKPTVHANLICSSSVALPVSIVVVLVMSSPVITQSPQRQSVTKGQTQQRWNRKSDRPCKWKSQTATSTSRAIDWSISKTMESSETRISKRKLLTLWWYQLRPNSRKVSWAVIHFWGYKTLGFWL